LRTLGPADFENLVPFEWSHHVFDGDYLLSNRHLMAAVADPELMTGRSASRWSIANPGGGVVALGVRGTSTNILRVFYPAPARIKPDGPHWQRIFPDTTQTHLQPGRGPRSASRVELDPGGYEAESGKALSELAALPAH